MSLSISEFNALPLGAAAALLRSTCGASRWVEAMLARRPFESVDALVSAAEEIWESSEAADWHEAFSYHPRIGEWRSAVSQDRQGAAWSSGEQAGVDGASTRMQNQLAAVNRAYEERFGHIFIVSATGKPAEVLLELAQERLKNDPEVELRIAAGEQRRITTLRLRKLFGEYV